MDVVKWRPPLEAAGWTKLQPGSPTVSALEPRQVLGQVYMAGCAVTEIFGMTATGKNNFLGRLSAGVGTVSLGSSPDLGRCVPRTASTPLDAVHTDTGLKLADFCSSYDTALERARTPAV